MIDPGAALREGLLGPRGSSAVRRVLGHTPGSRSVASRFVAGETAEECVRVVDGLLGDGRLTTVELLAGDTEDAAQASRIRDAHLETLAALRAAGLTSDGRADVSVRLDSVGSGLPEDGAKIALDNTRQLCEAAARSGTTVTVCGGDDDSVDSVLGVVRALRSDFPWVGVSLRADLRRTEDDCRELAVAGSRVRLCAAAGREPESVAYRNSHDVGLSFVRCVKVLMEGDGYPMVATDDPRLIEIARSLADKQLRSLDSFEFQLPLGVRTDEQHRFAAAGYRMRVHVPYGADWTRYVTRLVVEHPANTMIRRRRRPTKG